jgi:hypothetical protein
VTVHFRQNGAGWLTGRDGSTATAMLPDVKGLHYIRYLLQRPGLEVEAADVIDAQALSA